MVTQRGWGWSCVLVCGGQVPLHCLVLRWKEPLPHQVARTDAGFVSVPWALQLVAIQHRFATFRMSLSGDRTVASCVCFGWLIVQGEMLIDC